jgi:hypothetical protein
MVRAHCYSVLMNEISNMEKTLAMRTRESDQAQKAGRWKDAATAMGHVTTLTTELSSKNLQKVE